MIDESGGDGRSPMKGVQVMIHPLAGIGVNFGCLDAAVLCDVLLLDLAINRNSNNINDIAISSYLNHFFSFSRNE